MWKMVKLHLVLSAKCLNAHECVVIECNFTKV